MSVFKFLNIRSLQEEIMDDFSCDGEVVDQTLRELHQINTYLGGNQISIGAMKSFLDQHPQSEYKIVDLGCGGGDTMKLFAKWGKKNNRNLELCGVDANEYIIEYAETNTKKYKNIAYQTANIFGASFQSQTFDIAHSSLFLHHFQEEEIVELLEQLLSQVKIGIIINDLHRHWISYFFTKYLISRWSKSEMVKYDSILSVARSFTRAELERCLQLAKVKHYSLKWRWAFRWELIIWK